MSKCPNNNKDFDNFLFKSGLIDDNLSSEDKAYQRRRVYYTICITLRLLLAGLILQLKDKAWVPYVFAFFSGYSVYNYTFNRKEYNQWWSNKFQLAMAVIGFIVSILIIFKVGIPTYTMALVFFISIFGGVFQSLLVPSC